MTDYALIAAIGETDDDLLLRAEKAKKRPVLPWLPAAACLLLCAVILPFFLRVLRPANEGGFNTRSFDTVQELYDFIAALPDTDPTRQEGLLYRRLDAIEGNAGSAFLAAAEKKDGTTVYTQLGVRRDCLLDGKTYRVRLYLFFNQKDDRVFIDGYEEQGKRMEPVPGVEVKYSQIREPAFTHAQAIFRYEGVLYVLDLTTDEAESRITDFVGLLFRQ